MNFFHNEDSDKVTGGPLDFLKELEERRRGLPGLSKILAVDRKIRRLPTEKAGQFKNMSWRFVRFGKTKDTYGVKRGPEALESMSKDEKQDARGRKTARSASSPSSDRKVGRRRLRQKEAPDATVSQKMKTSGTIGRAHPPQGTLKGEKRVFFGRVGRHQPCEGARQECL